LDCPASEPLRPAIFGIASIFDLWCKPWSVARLLSLRGTPSPPIPRKGSGSTITTTKSGEFTVGWAGKGQFLWEDRRNLDKQKIVRETSSPGRVSGVSYLCNDWCNRLGNSVEEIFAPVLVSESTCSLPGGPARQGARWKLRAVQEDRESKRG